jgi:hypothetical protein
LINLCGVTSGKGILFQCEFSVFVYSVISVSYNCS